MFYSSRLCRGKHRLVPLIALAGLALFACADHTLDTKNEQTEIHDPWPDEDAELIALHLSGRVIAPRDLYESIHQDLEEIRNNWCESIGVLCALHPIGLKSRVKLTLRVNKPQYDAMVAGEYHYWDQLNEYYNVSAIEFLGSFPPSDEHDNYHVALSFIPRLNTDLLVPEYNELPGVKGVLHPTTLDAWPDLVASINSYGVRFYEFKVSWNNGPEGSKKKHTWNFRAVESHLDYLGDSGDYYYSIFQLQRRPGLGFCPEVDRIFRLSIDQIFSHRFTLSGSVLRGFSEPTDECMDIIGGTIACVVQEPFEFDFLLDEQIQKLDSLINAIPDEDIELYGGCDPCLITRYYHRGNQIEANPCAWEHTDEYWDAIDVLEGYLKFLITLR